MIPKKVKIGWRTYTVSLVDEIDNNDDKDYFGIVDYKRHTIQICNSMVYDEQVETLLHEIIHAMFYQAGHAELRENEDAIECVANGFMELIKDNPKLFIKEKAEKV